MQQVSTLKGEGTNSFTMSRAGVCPGGGDFDDLYPDVCVEGLKKDPF